MTIFVANLSFCLHLHTLLNIQTRIGQILAQNILRVDRTLRKSKMRVQVFMLVLMLFLLFGVWFLYLISWNIFSKYSNKCNKPQIIKAYPSEIAELSEPPAVSEIFSLDLISVSKNFITWTTAFNFSQENCF